MKKFNLSMFLTALGLLGTLLAVPAGGWARPAPAAPAAVSADPHLSGPITVSAHDDEQYLPAVAYNWKHHEYLVVWHDTWAIGSRDIRAARLSEQGQVLDEFLVYEDPTKDSAQPDVDYDPVHDRYLVVWSYDASGSGSDWDVYGRFIPWNGPDPSLTAFPICTWATQQWNPKVAYGRAVEEFLVVWMNEFQAGTLPMYTSGRRVSADGSGFPGGSSDLTLSDTTLNRINPDVAYNLARNEYLVVFDDTADIWGIRLTGDLSHNFGGEYKIAGWPDAEIHPAVAACRASDQYLVAWQSDQGSANDAIYARYLGGDGTPAGVKLIDDTTSPEKEASLACSQTGDRYLVAWQTRYTNLKYGIWGRMAYPNETLDPSFGIVPPGSSADRTNPVVAGGDSSYLVAWEHQRDGTAYQDIHGRVVYPYAVFLPLLQRNP